MPEDPNGIGGAVILSEMDRLIKQAEDSGEDVERWNFIVLKHIYQELRDLKKEVRRNPFFILGGFVRANPKLAMTLTAILLLIINMWFVSGWRRPLLIWLGIPPELVP